MAEPAELPLILASASPRRSEILMAAGIPFIKRLPPPVDETPLPGETPLVYVKRLAREKALAVAASPHEVVLGADTTVVVDAEILAKPEDDDDARRMLRRLSARSHEVLTGICLRRGNDVVLDCASTRVWFLPLTPGEIDGYVASGEPRDKAGAYGIQGLASRFVQRIEGCFFNVVGLPVSLLYQHLRGFTRPW